MSARIDWVCVDRVMQRRDPGRLLTHDERLLVTKLLHDAGASKQAIADACRTAYSTVPALLAEARERTDLDPPVQVSRWQETAT